MPVVILIVVIIALVVIVNCVKIVPQAHAVVVERLGGYLTTWSVGLHFKVPFIDRIAKRVLLKEQVVDFPPQPVITKDNVTMQIDTVVYFQITDPKLYAYGVENPIMAIENLTATTLRNIIGDLELDDTVTVYRGVTTINSDNLLALSWTLDYETADWFARRFDEDGTVYKAQIDKEHIFALFNGRDESEVVLDPKYLKDITQAQEPTQGQELSM